MEKWDEFGAGRENGRDDGIERHHEGVEPDEDGGTPAMEEHVSTEFFHEVMRDLSDTNFARGWSDPTMYRDFLAWCESSEDADHIISQFSPQIPCLLVDEEENVRLVSMQARVASVLMRALLEAYEQKRIEEFLSR